MNDSQSVELEGKLKTDMKDVLKRARAKVKPENLKGQGPRLQLHYPILEAAIRQSGINEKDLAEMVQLRPAMFSIKKKGTQDWRLGEAVMLRDIVAPYLTIEELFTPVPNFMEPPKPPTEEEQRRGFNPEWLSNNEEE